ncbi:response regulator transcription factor [Fulvivirga maritima]|uniref:response regulator transcription factor n=1 Tax=Fulvivirga maritima TaxID=2904247 RepID=UPI001F1F65DA|nr:response regulator transcription factor [Fulvivirga maritima]UII24997.1 response regulator transcription factor [Fulvivirga maritima]
MKYKVVVVDDHILFAQALENLVNNFEEFHVLYHAKNGQEFLQNLEQSEHPHIALMDINMPVLNGIETMKVLNKDYPDIKVLALSMDNDEHTIIKMLKAGAKGYLLKDIHPTAFHSALKTVIKKGFYYSDEVANTVMTSMHKPENDEIQLKEREIEFLKLVCTEKTYKEIASEMCLSPKTIDGYREALFEKLHVKSRIGLVLYAIKHHLYKI